MSLDKIFGLYTVGFLVVTVLIGTGEKIGLFSKQMIGWIYMALSLAIYVFIGILWLLLRTVLGELGAARPG